MGGWRWKRSRRWTPHPTDSSPSRSSTRPWPLCTGRLFIGNPTFLIFIGHPMYPSEWPAWLRESLPGWVVAVVLVWFSLQRYLDKPPNGTKQLHPYGRPTRDPRIICALLGFAAAGWMHIGSGQPTTHPEGGTEVVIGAVIIIGAALAIVGAFVRSEWTSIGLELAGCIFLAGSFTTYMVGYFNSVQHWAILCGAFAAGNALRVIQLLRRLQ